MPLKNAKTKNAKKVKKGRAVNTATRATRPTNPPPAPHVPHAPWAIEPRAILVGAVCVLVAVAAIVASRSSQRTDVASTALPDPAPLWAAPTMPPPFEMKPTKSVADPVKTVSLESAATAPSLEPTATSEAQNTTATTLTGCLELNEGTFWLKDTSGAAAPKSRSWRSGFIRKTSSSVELVDATKTLQLPSYVGRRVAATGTLMNREMRAHSLQRVAASCS